MAAAHEAIDGGVRVRPAPRWTFAYTALVAVAVLGASSLPVYDDAYFFKRFALNALQGHGFAWNPADGAVHGLTSQLYGWLITPLVALAPNFFVVAVRVFAGVCLSVAGWRLFLALEARRAGARAYGLAFLLMASPPWLWTVHTGMETAFEILVLTVAMLDLGRTLTRASSSTRQLAWRWALWAALVYLSRPDAVLVLVGLGVAWTWVCRPGLVRTAACAGATLAGLAVIWIALGAYYGQALPLSFFMKTVALDNYAPEVVAMGRTVKLAHAGAAMAFAAPVLVWLALARRPSSPELQLANGERALRAGAMLGAALVAAYHLALTNEIMGYRARFYVPALVALAVAVPWSTAHTRPQAEGVAPRVAGRPRVALVVALGLLAGSVALAYARGWIPGSKGDIQQTIPAVHYAVAGVGAVLLLLAPRPVWTARWVALAVVAATAWSWPVRALTIIDDHTALDRARRRASSLRGLEDVRRCLLPTITAYHSEMGVPGLWLPDARWVDVAGILSPEFSVEDRSFQAVCARDTPEVIFLPHKNYRALNAQIRTSECFANYVRMIDRSSAALHVRRDLAAHFAVCAREDDRWRRR